MSFNAKIVHLQEEKDNLVMTLTLQQKGYQTCLNNLDLQNNRSVETSNNFQIVHGTKSSSQTKNERNTPGIYTLNTAENQSQTLSDIPDTETQTEAQIYSHPKGNEINTINDQTENMVEPQNKQSSNSKARDIGSDIVIIGDSIVKNIQPRKLSRKKVHKYTFPGKTADQIEKEINSDNLKVIPSHIIIHVGTNNLPLETATECAQKIEKLATKVKKQFPDSKIGLSGVTVRHDIAMLEKIKEVNKEIGHICTKLDVSFIDNSIINDSCLNNSKLHLNAKGSAILAVHFINFLKGGNVSTLPRRQRYENFQRSAMQKLGELLKIIVPPDRNTRKRKH